MKKVLAAVLMVLACAAAYAETDYTVERKVNYLWRRIMGSGGSGGDYPTKEWVDNKLGAEAQARADGDSALSNRVTAVEGAIPTKVGDLDNDAGYTTSAAATEIARFIVNEMAADGWVVDGVLYKLVVQAFPPPPPAETTFVLGDGTEEVIDISGTLELQTLVDNGFYNMNSHQWVKPLARVEVGTNVTAVGNLVFSQCSSLTSVTLHDSVTTIGNAAFFHCTNLSSIDLGNGVTSIGSGAFTSCSSLTSVVLPGSVASIDDMAFWRCSGLTSVAILGNVASIGSGAFSACNHLMSVTMSGKDAASVQGMSNYSWDLPSGCVITCSDGTITLP